MARWYRADLHIHTALSACAEPEMTPPAIMERARVCRIELVAATDHNSAGNMAAMAAAGRY